jgi:hypothetical protein
VLGADQCGRSRLSVLGAGRKKLEQGLSQNEYGNVYIYIYIYIEIYRIQGTREPRESREEDFFLLLEEEDHLLLLEDQEDLFF